MRIYLFLYPVMEYFDKRILEDSRLGIRRASHINRIIARRYRDNGFRIYWLLFREECSKKPDRSSLSWFINIEPSDTIITSNYSARQMDKQKKYAKPHKILEQLPSQIKEIVLGGFHMWDCVDRLASRLHYLGIPTYVDEDTTDLFYGRMLVAGINPEKPTSIVTRCDDSKWLLKTLKEVREPRPWLMQV